MKKIFTLLVVVSLAACGPSPAAMQTAIAQTLTAQPTATIVPFPALQLDNLIFQRYDLPYDYTPGSISKLERSDKTALISGLADYYIRQDIYSEGHKIAETEVWVYQNKAKTLSRYQDGLSLLQQDCHGSTMVCATPEPYSVPNLGEAAMMQINHWYMFADLFFYRCSAVTHIIMLSPGPQVNIMITTYAQHLDKRLTPFVCR
jgi:hypothetical protein